MRELLVVTVLSALVLGGFAPTVQAAPADDPLFPAWFAWRSSNIKAPPPPSESSQHGEILLTEKDEGRHIELKDGQTLVISLEANPSTGYLWEIDSAAAGGSIRQVGEVGFEPQSDLIGAPVRQVMRFEVLEAGHGTLTLVYRRPWENREPKRAFSVQVEGVGTFTDVEDLLPTSPTPKASPRERSADFNLAATTNLPSAFNWCGQGGCTPVKNQGGCGSCWAFATSGVFESVIQIQDGIGRDLSEQYLVSCNMEGWGCDGGWWAFDYFSYKVPPGEPEAGAVYEADFPYQASEVACDPPHLHHEEIASWSYVGSGGSVPSVTALKQAIYDYGPVAAAICVASAFQNYDGGVFNTEESSSCPNPNNPINHGVVLVGWDDNRGSNGAWRLKNSWGSDWGEGGYMWIQYGTSRVGLGAAYVDYAGGGSSNSPPYTPYSPTPPDGAANQSVNVDLVWSGGDPDGDLVTYDVYLGANDSSPDQLVCSDNSSSSCDPGTLDYGTHYYWEVVARDSEGESTTGPVWDFTTEPEPNSPPYTPSSPTPPDGATNQSVNVDLAWSGGDPDGDLVTYDVYLEANDPSPDQLVCSDTSSSSCDPGALDYGTHYYWEVVARDSEGESTTGPVWDFTTEPEPNSPPYTPSSPTPPDGATNQSVNVDLAWSGGDPDGDPVTYDVYLGANDSSPDQLVCSDTSSSSCDPGTLDYGTHYYWEVVARDSEGESTTGPVWDFTTAEGAKVDFAGDPTEGVAPLDVAFTNLSSGDFDTCSWDFGDGATSSDCADVSHTYEDPGVYTVSLTVSGLGGSDTEMRTDYVRVHEPVHPVSVVVLRHTPAGDVFAGNTVHFVAQAQGTVPFTYAWALNGEPIGGNKNWLEHTFDSAGSYTVEVTVANAVSQDSALTTLVIQQPEPEGQPDLSRSRQVVNPTSVQSGDVMTYTLILRNNSTVPATASLADPIPAYTTYVPGSAVASDGAVPTLVDGEIHWSGQIVLGVPVVIEFAVQVQAAKAMEDNTEITSLARLEDGLGNVMLLGASASYNVEVGLTIENGTLYTNVPTVTLSLWSLESLPQMQIGNSGGFGTGTGWIDANITTSWVLATHDHLHTPLTVYAVFRGENGQQHGPVHDDIIYDPVPPRVTEVEIVNDEESGPTTAGTQDTLVRVTVSDDNSGVSKVQVSADPDFETWWEFAVNAYTIEIPIPWELRPSDGVFVRAVDRAGNLSDVKSAQRGAIAVYLPLVISSTHSGE